ncbi:MAG: bis(5'-nucleosyl)-tetraphosphatase (symmetrical) YqeK [Clostridia bacterium]|nr:bis(5'-nucleosyl)-tetraphosphatase (symmetrical) YqeK [Clostridia bacterium]
MNFEQAKSKMQKLVTPERYTHCLGVMEFAGELAEVYGLDAEKLRFAGLIHDCAKSLPDEECLKLMARFGGADETVMASRGLWHGPAGAEYAKEHFGIDDEIYDAIFYHTIGKENMSLFTQIIYLADVIEPNRDSEFDWAEELRELALHDIDGATLAALNNTITHVIERNMVMHTESIKLRNRILLNRRK